MNSIPQKKLFFVRMNEENENTLFQRKYFPKYYSKVIYDISDLQDGRVAQKAKRAKVIQSINITDYSPEDKSKVLSIFQRQRRYVTETNMSDASIMKYFVNSSKATLSVQRVSSWRLFLHIYQFDSLRVDLTEPSHNKSSNSQRPQAGSVSNWRFWHHIKKASHLKHLSLHFFHTISEQKINTFLHSLEKTSLF